MFKGTILCINRTEAIRRAGTYLSDMGLTVTDKPAPDVTHLLLPVPSFTSGDEYLAHILAELPDNVIIFGGNLSSLLLENYATVDFLQDSYYLAENAAITAKCALEIVEKNSTDSLEGTCVLILGWGRIGKCLCRLLEKKGCRISVAARKEADRAMVHTLGWQSIPIHKIEKELRHFDVIINTVPEMILPHLDTKENAIILELASKPGMCGENILNCRGLPNKMAPDASGELIAKTFLRLSTGEEV